MESSTKSNSENDASFLKKSSSENSSYLQHEDTAYCNLREIAHVMSKTDMLVVPGRDGQPAGLPIHVCFFSQISDQFLSWF